MFLATGETYKSLAAQNRVGVTTLSMIVPDVCKVIWLRCRNTSCASESSQVWQVKTVNSTQRWDYPHCIGAIDGKRVVIEAQSNRNFALQL